MNEHDLGPELGATRRLSRRHDASLEIAWQHDQVRKAKVQPWAHEPMDPTAARSSPPRADDAWNSIHVMQPTPRVRSRSMRSKTEARGSELLPAALAIVELSPADRFAADKRQLVSTPTRSTSGTMRT